MTNSPVFHTVRLITELAASAAGRGFMPRGPLGFWTGRTDLTPVNEGYGMASADPASMAFPSTLALIGEAPASE